MMGDIPSKMPTSHQPLNETFGVADSTSSTESQKMKSAFRLMEAYWETDTHLPHLSQYLSDQVLTSMRPILVEMSHSLSLVGSEKEAFGSNPLSRSQMNAANSPR